VTAGIRSSLIALACMAMAAGVTVGEAAATAAPTVGAIRWDGWWRGSPYARCLDPEQWHYRLPFYGRVVAPDKVELSPESQQVMDAEIADGRRT